MSKQSKAVFVFSDKTARAKMMEEALRVSKEGGTYSIRDYFDTCWMTEIIVYYPEQND